MILAILTLGIPRANPLGGVAQFHNKYQEGPSAAPVQPQNSPAETPFYHSKSPGEPSLANHPQNIVLQPYHKTLESGSSPISNALFELA